MNTEHIGDVPGWVHDLERRWLEEDARERVLVEPGAAALIDVAMPTSAPPQLAWEHVTEPGRRLAWSRGVTEVIVDAPGNRRGMGTTNHCMHGKDEVLEEVLDWRPFDYFTLRSVMGTPAGPVKFLTTFEFEPTADGTTVHMRIGAGKSKRDGKLLANVLPMFAPIFAANAAILAELVAEDVRTRELAAPPEPGIPAPKVDGLFAEMPSLPAA